MEKVMSQPPATYFAVTRERVENWNTARSMREQEKWSEHARFMDALTENGTIILGGPLDSGEKVLLIINAESRTAVDGLLADDPWTEMGLLRTVSVQSWEVLLDPRRS
jgi:uncharacterized protein YciI